MKRWLLLLLCPLLVLAEYPISPGDPAPDGTWTDQEGRTFKLSDFKGKALALTFIFTRCPLPDFCPRMSLHFDEVQRALAKEKGWHLLSLSFDPKHDTPAVLKAYAEFRKADLSTWTFATAEQEAVLKWGSRFGLMVSQKDGLIDHNLRTIVIDAQGRIQRVFDGNQWTTDQLIAEMKKAMR